jgi:hypothetical protein
MFRILPLFAGLIAGSAMAQSSTPEGAGGSGDAPKAGDTIDSRVITPEERERAKDYWTPERMQNAKPMPLPRIDRKQDTDKPK